MTRRVSRFTAAALFTVVLSLSAPSAFAAPSRDGGWSPDFGTRIVKVLKSFLHHFLPSSLDETMSPPKP